MISFHEARKGSVKKTIFQMQFFSGLVFYDRYLLRKVEDLECRARRGQSRVGKAQLLSDNGQDTFSSWCFSFFIDSFKQSDCCRQSWDLRWKNNHWNLERLFSWRNFFNIFLLKRNKINQVKVYLEQDVQIKTGHSWIDTQARHTASIHQSLGRVHKVGGHFYPNVSGIDG